MNKWCQLCQCTRDPTLEDRITQLSEVNLLYNFGSNIPFHDMDDMDLSVELKKPPLHRQAIWMRAPARALAVLRRDLVSPQDLQSGCTGTSSP